MDVSKIERLIDEQGARIGRPCSFRSVTGSTNDDARAAARAGAGHGASFLADSQTAGRGRQNHLWHSPPGENIYLSVLLRPEGVPKQLAPLSLAAGLAVAHTVDAFLAPRGAMMPTRSMIKWPNDVYVDARKIAGVLVEAVTQGRRTVVVVGVGLNVRAAGFPPAIADAATSLRMAGCKTLDREPIVARLLNELGEASAVFFESGLATLVLAFHKRDFLANRKVSVADRVGTACGIDDNGALRIRQADGQCVAVTTGEVQWKSLTDLP